MDRQLFNNAIMRRIFILIAVLITGVVYGQAPKVLAEGSQRLPIYQISPVENPAGMSFFGTYVRRLSLDTITSLGFASFGNSVSGNYAVSLATQLRKGFNFRLLTYPSSFNGSLTITQKVVRAAYGDSSINQANADGAPSNFRYISSGDHVVINTNDSLAGNTGLQTGFDVARFIFAKTPTSGTAVVTLRDAVADTVVRTQTINLVSADTIAYGKVDFTGLPEYLRYKFSVKGNSDSIFLLKVMLYYSKGLVPLQLGRGGSTLQNNLFANRAIMKGLMDDFNIRLIAVSVKEEAPRTSYPALRDSMAKYPGVSKLMIGSLPDSGPADTQVVYNAIARATLVPAGWSYLDAYNAFGGYAGLQSIGAQGDGTHSTGPPYDVIMNRVVSQFGWNDMSDVVKSNIDNIDPGTARYVKTSELWGDTYSTGTFETRKVRVMASAGSTAAGKVNLTNLNYIHFNNGTTGTTGLEAYGTQGVVVRNNGEMRAGIFTAGNASGTSQLAGLQLSRGLEVNSSAGAFNVTIRGDNDNNLLVTNGTNDRVSIGSSTGAQKFLVTGSARVTDSLFANNLPTGAGTDSIVTINTNLFRKIPVSSLYTFSGGLTNTANTVTNDLITPTSGSKTIVGGNAANNTLTIRGNNQNGSTNGNVGLSLQAAGALSNPALEIYNNGVVKEKSKAVYITRFSTSATAEEGTTTLAAQRYHFTGTTGTFTVPASVTVDGWQFTLFNAGTGNVTVNVSNSTNILFNTSGLTNTFTVGAGASRVFTWDATGGYYTVD